MQPGKDSNQLDTWVRNTSHRRVEEAPVGRNFTRRSELVPTDVEAFEKELKIEISRFNRNGTNGSKFWNYFLAKLIGKSLCVELPENVKIYELIDEFWKENKEFRAMLSLQDSRGIYVRKNEQLPECHEAILRFLSPENIQAVTTKIAAEKAMK